MKPSCPKLGPGVIGKKGENEVGAVGDEGGGL